MQSVIPMYYSEDPDQQRLQEFLNGTSSAVEQKQSREQLIAAARDAINNNNANAKALQADAASEVRAGVASYNAWRAIMLDQDLNDAGRDRAANAHHAGYDKRLAAFVVQAAKSIGRVGSLILPADPEFSPSSAVEAANIAAISSDADSYDPATYFRVARAAITRNDLPLVKRLHDKLSGLMSWKKPFVDNGESGVVLDEMADVLTTDDVIRSEAAKQWVEVATSDVRYLVRQLRTEHGKIDATHIVVGAMPTLFPDNVYPA